MRTFTLVFRRTACLKHLGLQGAECITLLYKGAASDVNNAQIRNKFYGCVLFWQRKCASLLQLIWAQEISTCYDIASTISI